MLKTTLKFVMVICCLFEAWGQDKVLWQNGLPDDPFMFTAVSEINSRIHQLAPVLNSPDLVSLESNNPDVPVIIKVIGEDREIDLSTGKYEDHFEDYEVHLYKIY